MKSDMNQKKIDMEMIRFKWFQMKIETNQRTKIRFIKAKHKTKEHKWYNSSILDSIQQWYESYQQWYDSYWHDLQNPRSQSSNDTIQPILNWKRLRKKVLPRKKKLDTEDTYDTMLNKDY